MRAAEPSLAREPGTPAAQRRPRVLLVEDSARLAASIRDYLERHAFEVFVEGDGLAVAERFERLKPDLVILDLMLPGKDGLTLCRELRRARAHPRSSSSPRRARTSTRCWAWRWAPTTTW